MSTSAICWFHFINASDWPLALFYNNKRVRSSKKKQVTYSREGIRARQRRKSSAKDYGSGLLL